ncbi:hypothetical protein J6590_097606, partial [Homalodisca vitripennis]
MSGSFSTSCTPFISSLSMLAVYGTHSQRYREPCSLQGDGRGLVTDRVGVVVGGTCGVRV